MAWYDPAQSRCANQSKQGNEKYFVNNFHFFFFSDAVVALVALGLDFIGFKSVIQIGPPCWKLFVLQFSRLSASARKQLWGWFRILSRFLSGVMEMNLNFVGRLRYPFGHYSNQVVSRMHNACRGKVSIFLTHNGVHKCSMCFGFISHKANAAVFCYSKTPVVRHLLVRHFLIRAPLVRQLSN